MVAGFVTAVLVLVLVVSCSPFSGFEGVGPPSGPASDAGSDVTLDAPLDAPNGDLGHDDIDVCSDCDASGGDGDDLGTGDISEEDGGDDLCPDDPDKLTPGECGCGVADTDTDRDDVPDCNDGCPEDPSATEEPCGTCFGDTAGPPGLDNLQYISVTNVSCSFTVDTSAATPAEMVARWCGGSAPVPWIATMTSGLEVVVLPLASFTIEAGQTVRLIGPRPVVLAVTGPVTIRGTIDAGALGPAPGAGGDSPRNGPIATGGLTPGDDCPLYASGSGQGMNDGTLALGGGGAGFRTNGGFGGGERNRYRCYGPNLMAYECAPQCPDHDCDNSFNPGSNRPWANNGAVDEIVPVYGLAAPNIDVVPLRGGCAGGKGNGPGELYYGGAGGGAVQIITGSTFTMEPGGVISSGGGGGTVIAGRTGGSGGGSGGTIIVEAASIELMPGAALRAHGGAGAGRDCDGVAPNGRVDADQHAVHSCGSGGRGGLTYWDTTFSVCNGMEPTIGDPLSCLRPVADWPGTADAYPTAGLFSDNNGGGGGGGSGGLISVRILTGAGVCD